MPEDTIDPRTAMFTLQGQMSPPNDASRTRVMLASVTNARDPVVVRSTHPDSKGFFVFGFEPAEVLQILDPHRETSFGDYSNRDIWGAEGEVEIRVVVNDRLLLRERRAVNYFDLTSREVWDLSSEREKQYRITGTILQPDGEPAVGMLVEIESRRVGQRETLANTKTRVDGTYEASVLSAAPPDVKALAYWDDTVLGESKLYCSIGQETRIEIRLNRSIPQDEPLFRRLEPKVRALLGRRRARDLTDDDIEFIVCKVNAPARDVTLVAESARASDVMDVRAEVLFGLAMQGLKLDARTLARAGTKTLEDALARATEAGAIAPVEPDTLASVVVQLRSLAVDEVVGTDEPGLLRRMFLASGLSEQMPALFVNQLLTREGRLDETIADFRESGDPDEVETLEFALASASVTLDNVSAISALRDRLQPGRPTQGLSTMDLDAWVELAGSGIDIPTEYGNDGDAPVRYAKTMWRRAEELHPTLALGTHWSHSSATDDVQRFVVANPSFDLVRTRVALALDDDEIDVPEDIDRSLLQRELEHAQRLVAVAPAGRRREVVDALRADGFVSATAIANTDRDNFYATMAGRLEEADAVEVYALAQQRAMTTTALLGRFSSSLNLPVGRSLQQSPLGDNIADLESLFGPMAWCACEHCQSVLSPAAYLVELLSLLRKIPIDLSSPRGDKLAARLRGRRGDIRRILLNCTNTHTVLPYIDLVNEVLERKLSPQGAPLNRQTTLTAVELRAHPEHLHTRTYERLRERAYPLALPFDLFLEEMRAYAPLLQFDRVKAFDLFFDRLGDGAQSGELTDPEAIRAIEHTRMNPTQWQIIAQQSRVFGRPWDTNDYAALRDVKRFLTQTGLEFDDLRRLLIARSFPAGTPEIRIRYETPCMLEGATLEGFTSADISDEFERIHRFIRLWRGLGWSIAETDAGNLAFGARFGPDVIRGLGYAIRLEKRFPKTDRFELLSWWHAIYTGPGLDDEESYFDRAFGHLRHGDPPPALRGDRSELVNPVEDLPRMRDLLARKFRLDPEDLAAAIESAPDPTSGVNPRLAWLSHVFRYGSIAHALGIGVAELKRYEAMLGAVAEPGDASSTFGWVQAFDAFVEDGLRLDDTRDVLGYAHSEDRNKRIAAFRVVVLSTVLRDLAQTRQTFAELVHEVRPPVETVIEVLKLLVSEDLLDETIAVVNQTSTLTTDERDELLEAALTPWVPSDLRSRLSASQEPAETLAQALLDTTRTPAQAAALRATAVGTLSTAFGVPADVWTTWFDTVPRDSDTSWAQALVREELADIELGDRSDEEIVAELLDSAPDVGNIYGRVRRAALLVDMLDLDGTTARWTQSGSDILERLPSAPLDQVRGISALGRLRSFIHLGKFVEDVEVRVELLEIVTNDPGPEVPDTVRNAIIEATGWPRQRLDAFIDAFGISGSDLGGLDPLLTFLRRLSFVAKARISPDLLLRALTVHVSPELATEVKTAVRNEFDVEPWSAATAPIRDRLRERQRDAMLAVFAYEQVEDDPPGTQRPSIAELHGRLLIDPQMTSCMTTSRVKEAVSAIQLLIQRCELGLEGVVLRKSIRERWEWMKNYRVWEANRKVFLYPENWIRPELRLDMTPQFKALRSDLHKSDLTDQEIETAYRRYLYELRDLSNLRIAGVYQHGGRNSQDSREGAKSVHVFGTTHGEPRRWFYTRRDTDTFWRPWEEVPLSIEAAEVLPLVYQRQLYVLWAQVDTYADKDLEREDGEPVPRTEARLRWATLEGETWSQAKLALEVSTDKDPELGGQNRVFDPERVTLVSRLDNDDLVIEILAATTVLGVPLSPSSEDDDVVFLYLGTYNLKSSSHGFEKQSPATGGPEKIATPSKTFLRNQSYFGQAGRDGLTLPLYAEGTALPSFSDGSPTLARVRGRPYRFHPSWHPAQGTRDLKSNRAYVLQDRRGTLVGWPRDEQLDFLGGRFWRAQTGFELFYHPFVNEMLEALDADGIAGVLSPKSTDPLHRQSASRDLEQHYEPSNGLVRWGFPREEFQFGPGDAYSIYNWELFFHAPMYIADRLMAQQRFEAALRWISYVFDPRAAAPDDPLDAWRLGRFYDEGQPASVSESLEHLTYSGTDPNLIRERQEFEDAIHRWRTNPFEPHLIAQTRRGAYMRYTVMQFLDCVMGWGDQLFRRDTVESINEATQLYLLAAQVLGDRPVRMPARDVPEQSFVDIEELDDFGNFLTVLENTVPRTPRTPTTAPELSWNLPAPPWNPTEAAEPQESPSTFLLDPDILQFFQRAPYFCLIPNDKLLGYWDMVADRLFKIRNCLNIDGIRRSLALFEPPIDPALLVRARAAGLDLSTVLDELSAPMSPYRFGTLVARAKEVNDSARALGNALLSALERRDASELEKLRATHERETLSSSERSRLAQLKEAKEQRAALEASKETVEARRSHFEGLLDAGLIDAENEQLHKIDETNRHYDSASQASVVGAGLAATPNFSFSATQGVPTGWTLGWGLSFGGSNLAAIANAIATKRENNGRKDQNQGSKAGINAQNERRAQQWTFEVAQATNELAKIDKDIIAAQTRIDIAARELETHQLQLKNAAEVDDFLRDRFTSEELYDHLASSLSETYYRAYKLAFDLAKKAQQAYQYELGDPQAQFIEFGHWERQREGLLAAERLGHDIHQLESAYMDNDRREYELTKTISLAAVDPFALHQLQATGRCEFRVAEALFELDHPSHYFRRVKTASLTIAAVAAPHVNLGATLTLLSSAMRPSAQDYDGSEPRTDHATIESIATSSSQSDPGMFELNFRDERYLPFEGRGAISHWALQLPATPRQFDYSTISDVVLELRYTAREGGETLANAVTPGLPERISQLVLSRESTAGPARMWSAKEHFPDAWALFVDPPDGESPALSIDLNAANLPYLLVALGDVEIAQVFVLAPTGHGLGSLTLTTPTGATANAEFAPPVDGYDMAVFPIEDDAIGRWQLAPDGDVDPDAVRDIVIIAVFSVPGVG